MGYKDIKVLLHQVDTCVEEAIADTKKVLSVDGVVETDAKNVTVDSIIGLMRHCIYSRLTNAFLDL